MASAELLSPFSRAECVERLRERVGDRFSTYRSVFGRINETSFWIEQRISYRNSFKTRLRAKLVEEFGGTRVKYRTGMHPLVIGFMAVWFGVLAIIEVLALFLAPGVGPILFMLCFGAALVGVGRFLARGEADYLLEFVCNSLNARKAE